MKLGDILHILRFTCDIEIRDKDNMNVCECFSTSKGIDPYVNCEVVEWYPTDHASSADAVFLIDLEGNNE